MNAPIQSNLLIQTIRDEIIQSQGYITFDRFMELALYTPEIGYYSRNSDKFSKTGDFITAPEISPLFAKCIAKQCVQVFAKLGSGDILEIGAGSGVFAKDLLLELEKLHHLPEKYLIFEISPSLQARQRMLLQSSCPHLMNRIVWLDKLPTEITGVIFANEVMDALPVKCFLLENDEFNERCVSVENDQFCWTKISADENLAEKIRLLKTECNLPSCYQSEINLNLQEWVQSLTAIIKKGLILLIDYGYGRREYYHPDRTHGTLMCFYQHRQHENPLINVGLQDITAHVDFTTVIENAISDEVSLGGYTTQAAFLLACGLLEIAQRDSLSPIDLYKQSQVIKTLTLPSQMGEVVKVMGIVKNLHIPLIGFNMVDRRRDL